MTVTDYCRERLRLIFCFVSYYYYYYYYYDIVSFYACGYRSFQEAFDSSRSWGLKRRAGIEGWAKLDFSKDDPDMIATQHMSEDEEMDYIHEKYLSEEIIEKDPRTNAISKWLEWMRWQKS